MFISIEHSLLDTLTIWKFWSCLYKKREQRFEKQYRKNLLRIIIYINCRPLKCGLVEFLQTRSLQLLLNVSRKAYSLYNYTIFSFIHSYSLNTCFILIRVFCCLVSDDIFFQDKMWISWILAMTWKATIQKHIYMKPFC